MYTIIKQLELQMDGFRISSLHNNPSISTVVFRLFIPSITSLYFSNPEISEAQTTSQIPGMQLRNGKKRN